MAFVWLLKIGKLGGVCLYVYLVVSSLNYWIIIIIVIVIGVGNTAVLYLLFVDCYAVIIVVTHIIILNT